MQGRVLVNFSRIFSCNEWIRYRVLHSDLKSTIISYASYAEAKERIVNSGEANWLRRKIFYGIKLNPMEDSLNKRGLPLTLLSSTYVLTC